jgi:hypothetical protein
VKNIHKKEQGRTRSKKVITLFLRKNNVPTKVEPVPKWNGQERVLVFLECFLFLKKGHSFFWNAFSVVIT